MRDASLDRRNVKSISSSFFSFFVCLCGRWMDVLSFHEKFNLIWIGIHSKSSFGCFQGKINHYPKLGSVRGEKGRFLAG